MINNTHRIVKITIWRQSTRWQRKKLRGKTKLWNERKSRVGPENAATCFRFVPPIFREDLVAWGRMEELAARRKTEIETAESIDALPRSNNRVDQLLLLLFSLHLLAENSRSFVSSFLHPDGLCFSLILRLKLPYFLGITSGWLAPFLSHSARHFRFDVVLAFPGCLCPK